MRWLILLVSTAIILASFAWLFKSKAAVLQSVVAKTIYSSSLKEKRTAAWFRLKERGSEIKNYAAAHHFNTNYCFLVDMKLTSGNNRFFVYDLRTDAVVKSGLVAHGYGIGGNGIHFSNVPGSNCSSLGKYKIGNAYNGRFGLAYKLYGLDSTNSNAFNRFVVLHSHECVPETTPATQNICMSQGCPTVSPQFLLVLKEYLGKAQQPMLLYIFN